MNHYKITNESSILITGGTGSFGREFVNTVVGRFPKVRRLVVYSRDELKQLEMSQHFSEANYPGLRYFIGDVRDKDRLTRALDGIDFVIHAAALKQVPAAEYNPFEFIKTNIIGAQNVIEASLNTGVKRVIALSTDKAAAPINLYGATKLCSDKLFVAANNIKGTKDISFSVVRYGNVAGSRGSVIPYFLEKKNSGRIPITSPEMTRFNITLRQGVNMVLWAFENSLGGEIFVPKIPSYNIMDLAKAIAPDVEYDVVGIRPGEKLHEEMITSSDSAKTLDIGNYYLILPNLNENRTEDYVKHYKGSFVEPGFTYNSKTNPDFLSIDNIKELINTYLNSR